MIGRGSPALVFLAAGFLIGGLALWWSISWFSPGAGEAIGPAANESVAEVGGGGRALEWPPRVPGDSASRSPLAVDTSLSPGEERSLRTAAGFSPLVSGTVLDAGGAVLPGAKIQVETARQRAFHVTLSTRGGRDSSPESGRPASKTTWATFSDSRGAFRVPGGTTGAKLTLRVSKLGYRDRELDASPGTSGLEVVLERAAIFGRALLAEGVSGSRIRVHLRRAGSAAGEESVRVAELAEGGWFGFSPLEPGLYELSFLHQARRDYLLTVGPFDVPTDEAAARRLASIDLRHLLRLLKFSVFDSAGEPVFHGTMHWRGSGEPEAVEHLRRIDLGAAKLVSPWPEIDLRVTVAKHESLELSSVRNGCRLDLAPAGGIVLELDYDCDLEGTELILYLKKPPLRKTRLTFRPTPTGRRQRPDLSAPGRWLLEWWVIGDRTIAADGTIRYAFSGRIPTPAEPLLGRDYLEVDEIHLAQRFVVAPDVKGLEEVLATRR